ncbi:MAG: ABC transporter ATP-binding protein, partial [Actinobacteria bacterium]|nr:ABC transporter ATP-binding protein [Actinomycetota bacterium]
MIEGFYEKELAGKSFDKKTTVRLLKFIKPYKHLLGLTIFLLLLIAGLQVMGPYLIKLAIDDYITAGRPDGLPNIVLLYGLVILFEFVIRYFQGYYTEYMG